jgi:hypothetical protein
MHFKVNRTASAENGQMLQHLYLVKQEKMSMSAYFALPHTLLSALDGDWSITSATLRNVLSTAIAVFITCVNIKVFHIMPAPYIWVFLFFSQQSFYYIVLTGWFS